MWYLFVYLTVSKAVSHLPQSVAWCCCDISCQLIYTGFGAIFPLVEVGEQRHLQFSFFSTESQVCESKKAPSSQLTVLGTSFQISIASFIQCSVFSLTVSTVFCPLFLWRNRQVNKQIPHWSNQNNFHFGLLLLRTKLTFFCLVSVHIPFSLQSSFIPVLIQV